MPVPPKLTKETQDMKFVEVWELMPDNVTVAERLATLPSGLMHSKSKVRGRLEATKH